MAENGEKVEKTETESLATESEIKELYNDVLSFVQDPNNRKRQSAIFAEGINFIHTNNGHDSYIAQGLKTVYTKADGTKISPGLILSVDSPCGQESNHEPSEIPAGAQVEMSIPGLAEKLLIDGTTRGSKMEKGGGKNKVRQDINIEELESYRAYLRSGTFRALQVEFYPKLQNS